LSTIRRPFAAAKSFEVFELTEKLWVARAEENGLTLAGQGIFMTAGLVLGGG
jgi:hypothetical protein